MIMNARLHSLLGGAAVAAALTLAQGCPARAEVVDRTANGFAIRQIAHIAAPSGRVYAALLEPAKWWDSEHTFSGKAANLTLDARAGGCFCETWSGSSVQHLVVVDAEPGTSLRLRGALGPFQGQAVDGALTFSLKASAGGTDLTLDNTVGGYMKGGFGEWSVAADAMLADRMARLKSYIETGMPNAKPDRRSP